MSNENVDKTRREDQLDKKTSDSGLECSSLDIGSDRTAASSHEEFSLEDFSDNLELLWEMGLRPVDADKSDLSRTEFKRLAEQGLADYRPRAKGRLYPDETFIPSQQSQKANRPPPPMPRDPTILETPSGIARFDELARKDRLDSNGQKRSIALPAENERIPLGSGQTRGILGKGGMGIVYLTFLEVLEVFRAVKLVTNPDEDGSLYERILTEAKISANMHHTNIVQLHTFGEWRNSFPYLEMEYIPGKDMARVIGRHGKLPREIAFAATVFACKALVYAHNQSYQLYNKHYTGIIHRDIKPANLMMTDTGVIKLTDFGISRPTGLGLHTMPGQFVGSLLYAAPEQFNNWEIDFRTDIYSLGMVLYEMLRGKSPFSSEKVTEMLGAKMAGNFEQLDSLHLNVPSRSARVVQRALQVDVNKRYPSAEAFLDSLEDEYYCFTKERPEAVLQNWLQADSAKTGKWLKDPIVTGKKAVQKKRFFFWR
jgi:tRNA A-37 threonylcarbamoyl transferase component Bud32